MRIVVSLIVLLVCSAGCGRSTEKTIETISLGKSHQSLKQHTEAIQCFTDVILSEPDNAEAFYYRAQSYHAIDNPTAALNDLRQAIALRPDWADPWCEAGKVYQATDRKVKALENLNQAIRLDSENASAILARGRLLYLSLIHI